MRWPTGFLLSAVLTASPLSAQDLQSQRDAYSLKERVPPGQWLRVRSLKGAIRVTASNTDNVEIVAVKTWRRGDPQAVRVVTRRSPDGSVLVCALWTENTTCTDNSYTVRGARGAGASADRSDVQLHFDIRVPKGVKVGVWTVNGDVAVEGVTSDVSAGANNGNVTAVSTGGLVRANSVNGSVHASMTRFSGNEDLAITTTIGSVIVDFLEDINANIDLSTTTGMFRSDWPVTITGRIEPRRLRAIVGKGGAKLRLATVYGDVELRKH
ncbi:MAG: DUF4097 family beta strand repeat-containing protein [Gemmatimonadota bacterium]